MGSGRTIGEGATKGARVNVTVKLRPEIHDKLKRRAGYNDRDVGYEAAKIIADVIKTEEPSTMIYKLVLRNDDTAADYDVPRAMVVRATSESEARRLAAAEDRATAEAFLDTARSTCETVDHDGAAAVILVDVPES